VTQERGRRPVLFALYEIVSRAVIFFFILSVLSFLLYLLGNFQEFLDSTQLYLLGLLRVSLLSQLFAGLLYIVFVFLLGRHLRASHWPVVSHRLVPSVNPPGSAEIGLLR
jgi:hypothetical protein